MSRIESSHAEAVDSPSHDALEKQQEFGQLFAEAHGDLSRFATVHCRNFDLNASEDLVQEAAITGWGKFHMFDNSRAFLPWMCGIIRYKAREAFRRKNRNREIVAFDEQTILKSHDNSSQRLQYAMKLLSDEDKSLIVMRHQELLSLKEISEILDVSVSTALRRVSRAESELKQLYESEAVDE